jgi:poly(A) polymerase
MISLKSLILEGIKEKTAIEFIKNSIVGTKFENRVFIAGGFVRDELLGIDPKDIDLVIDLPNGGIEFAEWITKKYNLHSPVSFPTFGTSKFDLKNITYNGIDLSSIDIECVMPRGEKYSDGSRKPSVHFSNLKSDAERRDSTVNSLLKNISTGEVLDLTGKGIKDLHNGILRTPLDPDITFSDDPLRMLRFIRQSTKYNWEIESESFDGIKRNAHKIKNISKERIRDEINKILLTNSPKRGFHLLRDSGLLSHIFKEFQLAVNMTQNVHHLETVFDHTLSVLQSTNPDLITRLMALFHDVGKIATRSETPSGIHFYGHEKVGEEIAEKIMRELKYPNDLINAVKLGVRNHMRLKHGKDSANITDKTLRKFKIEMGDQLERILDLIHADNISHADASNMPNQINFVRSKLNALDIKNKKPQLPINGLDLQNIFGLKPGPIIGKILGKITDEWFENPNISKDQAIELAKSILQNQPEFKEKITESAESTNSDEWDDWVEYIEYFEYDIEKIELKKLIKRFNLNGKQYFIDKIIKINREKKPIYLEYDNDNETFSLIKDIQQWIYDIDPTNLNIDIDDLYNSWVEGSINDLKENPGKVYHYTTEENWEKIKANGKLIGSHGTGLTNRLSHGIFSSTNPEEYTLGVYGNICLEIDLESFKRNIGELHLEFEPPVVDYISRDFIARTLEIEILNEIDNDVSPYTVIVKHTIPINFIKLHDKT